ncbi:hypothetical protein EH223_05175 [candidate division KSB1 bacterium]|nr:MAG: hypothetical protein EH223_05175 [candidate division KSB1 bacterium]
MNFQSPYDRESFLGFCSTRFFPEDFFIADEAVAPSFQTTFTKDIALIGTCPSLELHVYEIRHASENDPRIGLSKETFRLMAEYMVSRALVIFYSKTSDNYRLSLITLDYHIQDGKLTKEFSNPRRYSFFLGQQAKVHTPNQFLFKLGRIKDFDDLQKRFSVEVVNKEFYNKIAVLFTELVGGERKIGRNTIQKSGSLRLPGKPIETNHQLYQEFAVRLIGRLVFCWFLKKKSSNGGPPLVDDACLSSAAVNEHPNYYHSILEPLFFAVLNTPMEERHEFVKETFVNTPFLNGGLFEPHDDDFYAVDSLQHVSKHLNTLKIPDDWFKKLFDVFEIYNFTIDENTTVDIELSIDPEMLGRIFENLLAEINPETGETARKATGSYYTPRPIVEYMVDESLKQYLKTKTDIADDALDKLLSYSDDVELTPAQNDAIVNALDDLKALDPACGSGAFPMGLLQKMLLILQKVDPDAKQWQQRTLDSIPDPTFRSLIMQKFGSDKDLWDFSRKLGIIRKSIYGVDIQPIAVEISKLRVFLSLVVDEKVDDSKSNRGIEHLPNLEFKFIAANTLIGLPDVGMASFSESDQILDELKRLRESYFTSSGANKKEIEHKFISKQKELAQEVINWNPDNNRAFLIAQWNPFSHSAANFFDPDWMFGVRNKFDIVIANPPYGAEIARAELNIIVKRLKDTKNLNSAALFIDISKNNIINKTGILTYIVPKSLLYSERWFSIVRSLIANTTLLVDVEKAFENVKLEQAFFIFNQSTKSTSFLARKFANDKFTNTIELQNGIVDKCEAWICEVSSQELLLFEKIFNRSFEFHKISETKRGKGLQRFLSKHGEYRLIGGKNIGLYSMDGFKGYVSRKHLDGSKKLEFMLQPKILSQDIVAHIRKPYPHIQITSFFDKKGYILSLDTVQNTILVDNSYSYEFILSILNSKLTSWYTYRFIYCSAIRTMHFDNYYAGKIRIPYVENSTMQLFGNNASKLLKLNSPNDSGIKTILISRIDLMVYKLYDLTYDEVKIVDPQIDCLISREAYDRASIEELSAWEIANKQGVK